MPSSIYPVHRFTMRHLAEELVKRKHHVTWFEYGLKQPVNIPLPKGVDEIFVQVSTPNQVLRDIYEHRNHSVHSQIWEPDYWNPSEQTSAWLASIELCDRLLSEPKNRVHFDKLVSQKFDAVVVDDLYNPCGLLHTGLQKSVFVYWSMTGLRTESAWANQSPSPPSYIPVAGTGLTDELNFWQRSYNLAAYLRQLYIHQHIVLRRIDSLIDKHYPNRHIPNSGGVNTTKGGKSKPDRIPEAFYLERNASINFVNHPPIFDFARPYMPRVNFVGGLHCRKAQKLPTDLEKFVSSSNENYGFILITTGFTGQWKYAPQQVIENLVEAIRAKPEINFVWQYNGPTLKNRPKNLVTAEWIPQQDLLGHPKCKGHISHGGQNSVIESVWHGVPVIGWALTVSGYDNLLRVTARQAGLMLDKKQPSKMEWISVINRIYIRHYKDEMLLFQDMVTDVPYTELNHSAFWVEFIVRHQEVPHARSGADDLNILQYFLVDVILFVVSCLIVATMTIYYLLKYTVKLILWVIVRIWTSIMKSKSGSSKAKQPVSRSMSLKADDYKRFMITEEALIYPQKCAFDDTSKWIGDAKWEMKRQNVYCRDCLTENGKIMVEMLFVKILSAQIRPIFHFRRGCINKSQSLPSPFAPSVVVIRILKPKPKDFPKLPCEDAVFVVNGKRYPGDRGLLADVSPVFKGMFYGQFAEAHRNEIDIGGVGAADHFRDLLLYIYTKGVCKPNPSNVKALLELADRFDIRALVADCEKHISTCREILLFH
ncbi:UDP-glucoronosyl and UDP-glucosyl transferase domain-containing protein [Ditylenchus destructor]|uniref:glucuronosyltransferase n=1 Tax=Ditylenchus destructor TaxID=166010 RepID=A0AAD4NDG6_9BILA|nr:UDP-glucoronosyl and UDP-glucosyl transferase domain-containing protein [Ditylenchus destructor]